MEQWFLCRLQTCGGGSQVRTRRVTALPSNGGVDCPPLTETRVCNEDHCIGCSGGCTTYIHWGNTTCRRGTRLLYAGVAARLVAKIVINSIDVNVFCLLARALVTVEVDTTGCACL